MKRALQLLAFAVVVAVLGYFVWSTLFESRMLNVSSKTALVEMHSRIQLGDSEAGVQAVIDELKTERTVVRTNLFLDTWEVSMPFELGATDMALFVQYDPDQTVSAVALRTSDGIHLRPKNAPPDKGAFSPPKTD